MIPSTSRRSPVYTGTGAVSAYSFSFKVFQDSDIKVQVTNPTTGVTSTLTLGVDYTVSRNADQTNFPGGTVNLTSPLTLNYTLVVIGNVGYAQTSQLPTGGAYNATVVEQAMDRLAMQTQQLAELASRSLTLPATANGVSTELPGASANTFVGWNSTGNALVNYAGVASVPVSTAMTPVVAAATLALGRGALGVAASGDVAASGLTTPTATILGRATAGTGAIEELTAAQARTVLGSGASVGDTVFTAATAVTARAPLEVEPAILPITATVNANAMTITLNPCVINFRSTTLGSGATTAVNVPNAITLVIPNTATLGTVSAQLSRLIPVVINNAGTAELAVVNQAGGANLDETTLLSTTAISAAASSSSTVYSTTARSGVAFRVGGQIESTQAVAGTWATNPSLVQGKGGQAMAAMQSLGMGQTVQDVTGSRAAGTTYYNLTGKPIFVGIRCSPTGATASVVGTVNGVAAYTQSSASIGFTISTCFVVPPGGSYSAVLTQATFATWAELR